MTPRLRLSFVCLAVLLSLSPADAGTSVTTKNPPVSASAAAPTQHAPDPKRLDLTVGGSIQFELPADAKEVYVVNPTIANAMVRTPRLMFLTGLADGATTVIATDAEGRTLLNLSVRVNRDLDDLKRLLEIALPQARVTVTAVRSTIILTGTVDSLEEAQRATDIAKGYVINEMPDGKPSQTDTGRVVNALTVRGRDQVMLKVSIAEVQRIVLKQLGIDTTGAWSIGNVSLTATTTFPTVRTPTSTLGLSYDNGVSSTKPSLNALERAGVLRTLAEPTLTAISGESAKFNAGGEIPVPSGNTCALDSLGRQVCQTTFTYRSIGVSLSFSPVVLSEGRISLRIGTEVTDLDESNATKYSNVLVPAFKTRKMETTVELASGATLVSAGLIQQQSNQTIDGLPGLMDLPVIGALFRSRDYQKQETELLITVVPYIARPALPSALAQPDDGFAEASDAQTILLGRLNRAYGGTDKALKQFGGKAGFSTQ